MTHEKYCEEHKPTAEQLQRKESDDRRGSSAQRGYGARWQKARAGWLRKHPLCVECLASGLTVEASVIDHRVPHRGDMKIFWDNNNWQSLCASCHGRKTAQQDGGFGNKSGAKPIDKGQGCDINGNPLFC